MSVYSPSIPNSTDLISNSQAPIKTNFTQLNTQFGIDHIPFNDSGINGSGFHKKVTIPTALPGDPAGVLGGVIYTKLISAVPQLFFENSSSVVTQLTGLPSNIAANGTYNFPGGLILKWGKQASTNVPNNARISYDTPFPTGTFAITCCVAVSTSNFGINVVNFDNAGFNIVFANTTIFYIALGH